MDDWGYLTYTGVSEIDARWYQWRLRFVVRLKTTQVG